MDHRDHVRLIRDGVAGSGLRWLELGAGEGAFTLALADVLAGDGSIVAVDRDRRALGILAERVASASPTVRLTTRVTDFRDGLPGGPFDGVLAANSLHFLANRAPTLDAIRLSLAPAGRLVVVEYDADRGNPWVPHPFSFERWRVEAVRAGFAAPRLTGRVPSRFLGSIYAAVTTVSASPGPPAPPRSAAGSRVV